jgi:hypothetical protein
MLNKTARMEGSWELWVVSSALGWTSTVGISPDPHRSPLMGLEPGKEISMQLCQCQR